ncbi:hypothetical protein CSW08_13680 [Confluentibacter flavum]|uniref:Uncharacterized protein n=1 Tax=Confluentibacter flavum TaxID=1909700 RepID=A0A2N3HHT0_9FLAO|nr:hypothetical protein CSW08_13680 [Confluentibacter flavum]
MIVHTSIAACEFNPMQKHLVKSLWLCLILNMWIWTKFYAPLKRLTFNIIRNKFKTYVKEHIKK